jgi:LDH2 family malate/lactate/ureidoglycolate dehydrogenase
MSPAPETTTGDTVLLEPQWSRLFCLDALSQVDVAAEEAAVVVDSLLDASLHGVDSHGLALLPLYIERIRSGQIVPGRRSLARRDDETTALLDGQHGVGPVLACEAMDLATEKATRYGLGAVSLLNSNYIGALAFYAVRACASGMMGVCTANATPRVAPYGGSEGLHGTNPIAYAAPMDGAAPLVFDISTGHSGAKVKQALDSGTSLPEGIAVDKEGHPTVDAQAGFDGVLLPVGGALGSGLGLLVDLLSGGLAGGPIGPEIPPHTELEKPYGCGFFALVIDPERFGGRDLFAQRVRFLAEATRQTRPAHGVDEVRAPGDRAETEKARRQEQGIPMTQQQWQSLLSRLVDCGVTPLALPDQPS